MFSSTMSFRTRPTVKELASISLAIAMLPLLSCSQTVPRADSGDGLTITEVRPAVLAADPSTGGKQLPQACSSWTLSKEQVAQFFSLSQEYPEAKPHEFYDLPCTISGTLIAEGRRWDYTINAASTATWTSAGKARYWGCRSKACAPLVLLMPDALDPETD